MPFLGRGYAAVRFTEPSENFAASTRTSGPRTASPSATWSTEVDFPYVASVARVNAAVAGHPGPRPAAARPTRTIGPGRLENDTDPALDAGPEPDLAGYEVVWRDTDGPVLGARPGRRQRHRATLTDLSKDDLHFGVRAVDRDGHRSPVAFPLPPARAPAS